MTYRVKNWDSFQHYKDRSPSWLKLHKSLLDDYEFQCLPVASRAIAPMLWLLASEHKDPSSGVINGDHKKIAFRLRMTEVEVEEAIKPLLNAGFVEISADASALLARPEQNSIPEKETYREEKEEEREKENIIPQAPNALASESKKQKKLTSMPENWEPNDAHRAKCREFGFDPAKLAEQFGHHHAAKNSKFADWDRAFFTWIGNAESYRSKQTGRGNTQQTTPSIVEIGLRVADRGRREDEQRFRDYELSNRPQVTNS